MFELPVLVLQLLVPSPGEGEVSQARPPAPARAAPRPPQGSLVIQQRMIIRVPRLPVGRTPIAAAAAPVPPIRWDERRTDRCVAATSLAGASITRPDSVDLVLIGGKRLRARLQDDCPSLDFYSGFYLRPTDDGKLCADRDVIRSRSGGACRIESFRALVPRK